MEGSQEAQFYVKENWMAGIYEFQLQVQVVSLYHLWQNLIGKNILFQAGSLIKSDYYLVPQTMMLPSVANQN